MRGIALDKLFHRDGETPPTFFPLSIRRGVPQTSQGTDLKKPGIDIGRIFIVTPNRASGSRGCWAVDRSLSYPYFSAFFRHGKSCAATMDAPQKSLWESLVGFMNNPI